MRKCVVSVVVLGFLAAVGTGCATHSALQQARASLDQAKAAGAEQRAPYEYHAADAYLTYAIGEQDESDWSAAVEFAEKSMDFSQRALQRAKGGGR